MSGGATHNLGINLSASTKQVTQSMRNLQQNIQTLTESFQTSNRIISNSLQNSQRAMQETNNLMQQLTQQGNSFASASQNMSSSLSNQNQQLLNTATMVKTASGGIENMNSQFNHLNERMQGFQNITQNNIQHMREMVATTRGVTETTGEQTSETQRFSKELRNMNKELDNSTEATKQKTKSQNNWLSSYTKSVKLALYSVTVWGAATGSIYGMINALRNARDVVIEVDEAMTKVRRVMQDATADFDAMQSSAIEMSIEFGENVQEVVNAMGDWARQGHEQNRIMKLTEASVVASNVAYIDQQRAVELLTSATLQFNIAAEDSLDVVDRLNEVSNNYATTAEDLAASIQESGAAANSLGIEMEELIGMTTALTASTAKTGNRIGTALRTVFSRMAGDMGQAGDELGIVEEELNAIGIAVRSSEGEFRDFMHVLDDLSQQWDDLTGVQQTNIAQALGGRRRYSDIISLMNNFEMALDATESAQNSQGAAMEEMEVVMQSLSKQIEQMKAQARSLGLALGEAGLGQGIVYATSAVRGLLEQLENTLVGLSENKALMIAFGGSVVSATLSIVGLALKTKIATVALGALKAMMLAIVANPIGATLTVIGAAALFAANRLGKKRKEAEELSRVQSLLNEELKEYNELTQEQATNAYNKIQNLQEEADELGKLVSRYEELNTAEIRENWQNPEYREDFDELIQIEQEIDTAMNSLLETLDIDEDFSSFFGSTEELIRFHEKINDTLEDREELALRQSDLALELAEGEYENAFAVKEHNAQLQGQISLLQDLEEEELKYIDRLAANNELTAEQSAAYNDLKREFDELRLEAADWGEELERINTRLGVQTGRAVDDALPELRRYKDAQINAYQEQVEELENLRSNYERFVGVPTIHINGTTEREVALEEEIDATEEVIEKIEEYIKILSGDLAIKDSEFFAVEAAIEGLEDTFEDSIDPMLEFIDRLEELREEFVITEQRLGFERDLFDWSELDFQQELESALDNQIGSLLDLKFDIEMEEQFGRDFESARQSAQEEIEEQLSRSENLSASERERLEEMREQVRVAESYSELQNEIMNDVNELNDRLQETTTNIEALEVMEDVSEEIENVTSSVARLSTEGLGVDGLDSGVSELESLLEDLTEEQQNLEQKLETETSVEVRDKLKDTLQELVVAEQAVNNQLDRFNENLEREELFEAVDEMHDDFLEDELTEAEQLGNEIEELEEKLIELAIVHGDFERYDMLKEIIGDKEDRLAVKELEEDFESLSDTLESFDSDSMITFGDISSQRAQFEQELNNIQHMMELTDSEREMEFLEEYEEEIKEILEDIDERSEEIQTSWADAIGRLSDDLFYMLDQAESKAEAIPRVFSSIFQDENIADQAAEGIGGFGDLGEKMVENISQALNTAANMIENDTSLAESIGTMLGAGIGAYFGAPQLGAQIGSLAGRFVDWVFGSDEIAEELQENVEESQQRLEDLGMDHHIIDVDYEGSEDAAEEAIEEMDRVAEMVEDISDTMQSGFESALGDAGNYTEFRQMLDDTLGDAIVDAVIGAYMEAMFIEERMDDISGMITDDVKDYGEVTEDTFNHIMHELDRMESEVEDSGVLDIIHELQDMGDVSASSNRRTSQSFTAGTTTSVTYQNHFTVRSQAFNGNKKEAKEFAREIAPYVREVMEAGGA